MSDYELNDEQLLHKLGLTDAELKDMQAKHENFVNGLNEAQKTSLARSLPSAAEAAATFGSHLTAEHLERFIRSRAPRAASVVIMNRTGSHD